MQRVNKKNEKKLFGQRKYMFDVINYCIILQEINLLNKQHMKKLFFFLAVAGLISFAACKSGETKVEATADSTAQVAPVDTTAAAPVADTVAK